MFVWIEGVNFDATMFDTNDLSTIRGSSMWLEILGREAKEAIGGDLVDYGASRAVLKVKDKTKAEIETAISAFRASDPWKHFTLIAGIGDSENAARAQARLSYLSDWSIAMPEAGDGAGFDSRDRTRPTKKTLIGMAVEDIAPSVHARRAKGRKARPNLFADQAKYDPPQSFDVIAKGGADLPVVVQNKLAVVVADASGAGKARDKLNDNLLFSIKMDDYRTGLARAIRGIAFGI